MKEHDEKYDWCDKNCNGKFHSKVYMGDDYAVYFFTDIEDAFRFKMRWA